MHRLSLLLCGLLAGTLLVGVAAADTWTPGVLGHGGPTIVLRPNCSRAPVQLPAGRDWRIGARKFVLLGFNIYQQQIHCLVHRVSRIKAGAPGPAGPAGPPGPPGPPGAGGKSDACWLAAGEVPKTSSGLDALRRYIDRIQDCFKPDPAG